jgi:CDP-glycerol glycerophosphotransferase
MAKAISHKNDVSLPKVTVVMPVYNVADYLLDALVSVLSQSYKNFEVIAVNDGSTDGSEKILEMLAAEISHLTVINQKNLGVAEARNRGVAAVSSDSKYLMFIDSDDLMPKRAIAKLVAAAESTDAQLTAGKTVTFYGVRYFDRPSTASFFAANRAGITLEQMPELLGDAVVWNKLFRTDYWRAQGFKFPSGVNYEDMTLAAESYLNADRITLVSDAVYFWRVRAEGESRSTVRFEQASLEDRLLSMEQIANRIKAKIRAGKLPATVLESYQQRIIRHDLQLFVPYLEHVDATYFSTLKVRCNALVGKVSPDQFEAAGGRYNEVLRMVMTSTRAEAIRTLQSIEKAENRPVA